jgi:hypothetical protein
MRANRLPASRGVAWIGEGFGLFRVAPLRQLLLNLLFLVMLFMLVALPRIGFLLVWLMVPLLAIGPHALARDAARGAAPTVELLLEGFRRNPRALLRLGAVFAGAMALMYLATAAVDDGRLVAAVMGRVPLRPEELQGPMLQRALLVAAVVQTAVLGLLWYAPLLVAWNGVPVLKAIFFSAAATLLNWRAFLVFGLALSVLFTLVLMLALGTALLLSGPRAMEGNAALFAVTWTLLPIGFAASYISHRDVFGEAPGPVSGTPPANEGSP